MIFLSPDYPHSNYCSERITKRLYNIDLMLWVLVIWHNLFLWVLTNNSQYDTVYAVKK